MKKEGKRLPWNITTRDFRLSIALSIVVALACCLTAAGQRTTPDPNKFTVSFISTGGGIDYKAEERFRDFVKKYSEEHHSVTLYKMVRWGKEGETDYNFNIRKLSPKQKKELKDNIIKMFEDNALVRILDKPEH
jgi:hypothetical protein